MPRLESKSIIVTGAASGIGRGTALRLLDEGARVAALDLSGDSLIALADSVPAEQRDRLFTHRVDISDEKSVTAAVAAVLAEFGSLDALVNAAGILFGDHTHEVTLDRWNTIINVNLTGTFLVTREALPSLTAKPGAVIINFASTSAFFAHPYMAAYSASKGAIAAFTHSIALEYAKQGLRAVSVVPGGITSGITSTTAQNLPADTDWSLFTNLQARLGDGSQGTPENVSGIIATLISDDGAFITGTEIRIDGGAHM
ncbi:SDR family oxidoreductase [Microbacterium sp. ANT_H45B]|uniref:SDR family NAD(P)-dependent oxidoreductase n=1 Tax=Microbacterium sp. ANT_H45B TaxID=2597346 RepID=UPI0011EF1766|nr:SDR family oxidoreductase [Microbacterium sp. ANT_H45B]KAA0959965.1 SDR family oxidoreductase [Microbacterium sp. ANT_H45B]